MTSTEISTLLLELRTAGALEIHFATTADGTTKLEARFDVRPLVTRTLPNGETVAAPPNEDPADPDAELFASVE